MSDEEKTPDVVDVAGKIDEVGRSLSAEVKAQGETLRAENEDLKARLEKVEEKARTLVGTGTQDETVKPISIARLAYAIGSRDWGNAGYEKEAIEESRALAAGTDSSGGYLVAEQYLPNAFIELIRYNSVCFQAGVRQLTGLMGSPVEMGKQTGGATAYWGSENVSITESEQAFGDASMVPHPLTGLVKMSNMLLRLGNPSVERLVQEDLAKALALKFDLAILKGTGTNKEPMGIINTTGIKTKSMNATVTVSLLDDMIYALDAVNTLTDNCVFIMHTREWATTRKALVAAGITFNTSGKGVAKEVQGYRVLTTNQLSITEGGASDEGEILFGNYADCLTGEWGAMEFKASQEAGDAFAKNQTWIRAIQLLDVAVRHPESFCYTVDARA